METENVAVTSGSGSTHSSGNAMPVSVSVSDSVLAGSVADSLSAGSVAPGSLVVSVSDDGGPGSLVVSVSDDGGSVSVPGAEGSLICVPAVVGSTVVSADSEVVSVGSAFSTQPRTSSEAQPMASD